MRLSNNSTKTILRGAKVASNIPIILAGAGAGGEGNPPPALVDTLTRGATAALNEAEMHRDDYIDHTTALASAAHDVADTHAGEVWTDTSNHVIDLISKADKAKDLIVKDITGQANAAMQKATDSVIDVGGRPYVLIGDAVAANQAGSHWADAMNRLVLPAIEQQKLLALNPTLPPPDATPYTPVADGPAPYQPDATVPPGVDSTPPTDPTCPSGYRWGTDPLTGQVGWVCPDPAPDRRYIPPSGPAPLSPPPPAVSPPATPPCSPPPAVATCPPPTIVINVPGCSPLTYPPGSDQPTKPPTTPPPPAGTVPPPAAPPPATLTGGVLPVGPIDGPGMCQALDVLKTASKQIAGINVGGQARDEFKGAIDNIKAQQPFGGIAGSILDPLYSVVSWMFGLATSVSSAAGIPDGAVALSDMTIKAVTGFLERWAGFDSSYYQQPETYAAQSANPLNILSQGDIDASYLGNAITVDQWYCLTTANGNAPWQHQQAMLTKRTKPNISDLVQLQMRGDITDADFLTRVRAEGVLSQEDLMLFGKLAKQYWTLTDLMQWMVKDVANEEFVNMAGLDEDFDKSWTPDLQRMAEQIGVTKEQIKYTYRAQWQDIPLGQLFQMYWRLRPGRVDPSLEFTEKDLIFMMGIQEVQPNFRDKLRTIAYLPINRTDIMAAVTAGTMGGLEAYERFQDLGYSPADARTMTDMLLVKVEGQLQSSMGMWTRRKINNQYVQGAITRQEADQLLSRTIVDEQTRQDALNDSDTVRSSIRKGACIKGVKRRYYTGEYDAITARTELAVLGVELGVADTLISGWTCERQSRSKEPTVKMLRQWVLDGIIDWDEMGRRLTNLGYTTADANRIRVSVDKEWREVQRKEVDREQKAAEAKRRQQDADERRQEAEERRKNKAKK